MSGPRLKLQVYFAADDWLGPGKAELLELIAQTGSIAEAGRRMGMSYKRAWSLVETLNAGFRAPLVVSARGGRGVGGAQLTAEGREVVRLYRALAAALRDCGAADLEALSALRRETGD